jgi:N-acetyl-anhydromuramyl-L-alanine amidase AmpD
MKYLEKINNYPLSVKAYVPGITKKTNIVLHSSFSRTKYTFTADQKDETYLMKNWNIMADKRAGHYVVGRDGTIYKCFEEELWSNHVGAGRKFADFNKSTIAIFLANESYLEKENNKYYAFGFNKPYNMYQGKVFEMKFKGYEHWADFEGAQIDATVELIKDICTRNDMSLTMSKNTTSFNEDSVCSSSVVSCANLNRDSRSLPLSSWCLDKISSNGITLVG